MFTTITWGTYFSYVALACCAWYLLIAIRYYPQEIRSFALRKFSRERELNKPPIAAPAEADLPKGPYEAVPVTDTAADQLPTVVESLSLKLEEVVRESSAKGYSKEEFIFLLRLTLKEFPELNVAKYQVAIKTLVTSECEKFGFLLLDSKDLDMLWSEIKK